MFVLVAVGVVVVAVVVFIVCFCKPVLEWGCTCMRVYVLQASVTPFSESSHGQEQNYKNK